jgi:hypothetical protein
VTVTGIEPGASRVTLDDGRRLGYDRLLLATGAEPRRLHIPGADLDRVCYLRTLADCDLLRAQLDAGGRVVVVGAGWIGSEFAASARQRGLEVTVIGPQPLPNERIFGREVAAFYSDQYDVGMEYSGHAPQWDEVVFRGDPAGGEFIAFWLRGGCVAAGMNVNVWAVNEQIQALIRAGQPVPAAALADPGTTLESLAGEPAASG